MKNDRIEGNGKLTLGNGSIFKGKWENSMMVNLLILMVINTKVNGKMAR